MNKGYKEFSINHVHYYEHRVVAEKKLGRKLKSTEVVHHIDGNRSNNSPDNLLVFRTTTDHTLFHKGHNIFKDGDVWAAIDNQIKDEKGQIMKVCPFCKINLMVKTANMCRSCYSKEHKSKIIPSKQELIEKILSMPFTSIAKYYGVSDNAVRKWCIKYDLPQKHKDLINYRKCYLSNH